MNLITWAIGGKASLKAQLAEIASIDATSLPYNEELLTWLKEERSRGRRIVLATASHAVHANLVASHLNVFDEVFATADGINLKGDTKRDLLVKQYGERGFDYVGNDWADVSVWNSADQAHIVSSSSRLIEFVRCQGNLGRVLGGGNPSNSIALSQAMRPHQWVKNLLIFIPLLAAHRYADIKSSFDVLVAFIAFCLTASSVYLLNDMVDVTDDRHHSKKRFRPFAAGKLSLISGWFAWPILLILGFILSVLLLPAGFSLSLTVYVLITAAYSFKLKKMVIIDVVTLAALYTIRIIAGATAASVAPSFWLLSFSMFIFLSLALIKRYSELKTSRVNGRDSPIRGRGYVSQDLELVSSLGCSAGYLSVLVLALYIQDAHTAELYSQPQLIWLTCPLLLYWISRAWLIAHRGEMNDDPIVFALKDRASWFVIAFIVGIFLVARFAT